MSNITLCITSFNRWELLKECIDTLLKINTYPINKWIISEDSGDEEMLMKIKANYGELFNNILFSNKVGQCKSIDNMYNLVDTKYILQLEDDYKFYGNFNFIAQSIEILENNPDITRVGITHNCPRDWKNVIEVGTFDMMKPDLFGGWGYWSHTPAVIRLEDYKRIFPEGYAKYHENNVRLDILEYRLNLIAKESGCKSAILKNGSCITTGNNKSTYK
jgi:hypothetical protein